MPAIPDPNSNPPLTLWIRLTLRLKCILLLPSTCAPCLPSTTMALGAKLGQHLGHYVAHLCPRSQPEPRSVLPMTHGIPWHADQLSICCLGTPICTWYKQTFLPPSLRPQHSQTSNTSQGTLALQLLPYGGSWWAAHWAN